MARTRPAIARARHEAVAEPLGGHPVPGGGEPGPVLVDEVEAGHAARHGGVGLPRQGVEHLLQRVRDVERVGGAGERLVAPVLGGPPALRVEPGEAERGQVGERLGEHDGLRGPFAGQRERRDLVDVAAEGDRHEQAAAVLVRAGGGHDVGRVRGGRLQQHDGGGRERPAQLAEERVEHGRGRARDQGRLGEAAQRRMRDMRSGTGGD